MTHKQAVAAADKAFSAYIRARDPKCITCGAPTADCSHVFRRWHHATRWDQNNAYGQCKRCHFIHHKGSESFLLDAVKGRIGAEKYEDMRDRWEKVSDFKTYQLEEVARYYRDKLENITLQRSLSAGE
jgi:hypothetical protein